MLNAISLFGKQETSLHGLKYVTNSRTVQEKSMWVVLLIAALVAASVFVYRQGGENRTQDYCNSKTASSVYALDDDTISKILTESFHFSIFYMSVAILHLSASNM